MSEITDKLSVVEVNHSLLDDAHRYLAKFALQLGSISDNEFPARFLSLLGQMENHFADEEQLMERCQFRHSVEHKEEHRMILQEMRQLIQRRQPFARAYIRERLPERLNLHISRMDSMLASALNQ